MDDEKKWQTLQQTRAELEALFGVARSGDRAKMRDALEQWASKNERPASEAIESFRDANGRCCLHFAASAADGVGAVEAILELHPRSHALVDEEGNSPLHLAARVSGAGDDDDSPVASLLAAGAEVDASNSNGVRPLHHASGAGSVRNIRQLVAAGAALETQSGTGTPLHWAAGEGEGPAVRELLRLGASAEAKNAQGITAIIMAAARGSDDGVVALCDAGADTGMVLSGGLTTLHICADMGLEKACAAILRTEHGSACAATRTTEEGGGLLPVELAARSGHRGIVELLLPTSPVADSGATVDSLLSAQADSAAPAPSDAGSGPSTQPVSEPAAARASPAARNEQAHAAALDAKANGNALFKAKDYAGASAEYRRAISIEPTEKVRRRLAARVA